MKNWLAEVIETGCDFLCALTGHVYGCWMLNHRWSPLHRVHWWAVLHNWRLRDERETATAVECSASNVGHGIAATVTTGSCSEANTFTWNCGA